MKIKWQVIKQFKDIKYEKGMLDAQNINKITINRPKVRNSFRPQTVFELKEAFELAREDQSCGVIIFTGEGKQAFCAGGDQKIRGDAGYIGPDGVPRLNILDVQKQIRYMPKPIIAMVAGYAVGGGHVLHMLCDLTIAASNAKFGQTGPNVGSFDGGWGASYMARIIGQKRAREVWFLCKFYSAKKALDWGLINEVVDYEKLEETTIKWSQKILEKSPLALRMLKGALNADCDGQAGLQQLAGDSTMLFYMTEEAQEGRDAFKEKRKPNFKKFPKLP
tara:strand:- start:3037 stop:3867 length:831 start_codon:yes stop_codon:yes gene_type:complete